MTRPHAFAVAGHCYRNAHRIAQALGAAGSLVHGYPRLVAGPHAGRRFGHAWVEVAGVVVVDPGSPDEAFEIRAYYRAGRVDPRHCRRYSPEEACRRAADSGHWGPWEGPPVDLGEAPLFAP